MTECTKLFFTSLTYHGNCVGTGIYTEGTVIYFHDTHHNIILSS